MQKNVFGSGRKNVKSVYSRHNRYLSDSDAHLQQKRKTPGTRWTARKRD